LNGCQSTKADPQERERVCVRKENKKEEIKAKVILETRQVKIA